MHIKSSVVTAASFPFQEIKMEKKKRSGKKRRIKDLICFLQENRFKPRSIFCVYLSKTSKTKLRQHIKLPKNHHLLILTKYLKKNFYDKQISCHLFGLIRFESPPISPKSTASSHEAAGSYETANCQPDSHHTYNKSSAEAKTKFPNCQGQVMLSFSSSK